MTDIIIDLIHLILVCIIALLFNKVLTKLSLANIKIEYLEQYIKIVESYAKEPLLEHAKALDLLSEKINSKFTITEDNHD